MQLPAEGRPAAAVRDLLAKAAAEDQPWEQGRGWSLVYDLGGEHGALLDEALTGFARQNALSSSAFPSAARLESAVIGMVASLVGGGHGVFCSGGTESILLALKAYRDRAGLRDGEVVVPSSAHPAFGKAAQLLGLTVVPVPAGTEGVAPALVEAALTDRTVAVAVSAPSFPFGALDPVADLAAVAASRDVGVHVDAAVGGLFLPFLPAPPRFGLDVPGVTSVSVDVHKYGYGAKGASVLLFADEGLRHASYYTDTSWPGGAYASGGVLGTRSVGPAAAAFASLVSLGDNGFRSLVGEVMTTASALQDGLGELGLKVLGAPAMSVFAMGGDPALVRRIASGLQSRGWWMDSLVDPVALHFVVFPRHATVLSAFLADASSAASGTAEGDALSSYGVMVRGADVSHEALREHLDRRFDGGLWS